MTDKRDERIAELEEKLRFSRAEADARVAAREQEVVALRIYKEHAEKEKA